MTKSLKDKLLKAGSKLTCELDKSEIYNRFDFAITPVPIINVLLSARLKGGVSAGFTMWAAPSRHFKTLFSLLCAKAWMDKNPEGILLFYDSEFGSPPAYFKSLNIDTSRVIHVPITDFEVLKFDLMKKVNEVDESAGDKIMIIIDSLGNLASKKEAADALNENSAADMTRGKEAKSFFRIITPYLKIKNIPMHGVQHVYDTMELYSKKVVSGGQGALLAADNVYIIGRQQDKEQSGADKGKMNGYHFIIKVEKSRFVEETSTAKITVSFKNGIRRWSGLIDHALSGGYIAEMSAQKYCLVDRESGELMEDFSFKKKNVLNENEIWKKVFQDTDFGEYLENQYKLEQGSLIEDDDIENLESLDELIEDLEATA